MSSYDVFIILHNHASTLAATLTGLSSQRIHPERVYIVNNASTDDWQTVCSAFNQELQLEIIDNSTNLGFSCAANQAINRGTTEWILSLNPDCRLESDYVLRLISAIEDRPETGSATGLLLRANGDNLQASDTVDSAGMIVTASGRHFDRGSGKRLAPSFTTTAWVFGSSGASALYRRQALNDIAYEKREFFDEGFFAYREDADVAWRLQRRGWSCLFVPEALAFHARGLRPENKRRGTEEVNRLSVRNRYYLRMSNADWRWHLACFPAWLIRDLVVLFGCLVKERSSLPGLKEAWGKRKIQRERGKSNTRRASVSGWRIAKWFLPGGHVRTVVK